MVVDLSIIIPAYKSTEILREQLPVLMGWINKWTFSVEVIIVVDGENVTNYSEALDKYEVTITGYEVNKGKGYAIKHGFKLAKAAHIIYTDADIPFTSENIESAYYSLKEGSTDHLWVIGDRTLPGSVYYDHISAVRKAGSDFFLFIIKHTLGKHFSDTQCGLKGFTYNAGAEVLAASKVNRFAFDYECLYIARHKKIGIIKIPVTLRNQSSSTVKIYADGVKLLRDIFKIVFHYKYD